jgi:colanic acid/amylovoran biosynthesis glycosyltransferase
MRIALIVSKFPSPEHPYIWEWVHELHRQGVDIQVIAEELCSNEALVGYEEVMEHAGQFNLLHAPLASLRQNASKMTSRILKPSFLWPHVNSSTTKSLRIRTQLRKFFEYLPWVGEHFDLIHFNAPQIAIRRFELKEIFHAPVLVSFRGQDFSFNHDRYDRILFESNHLHFLSHHSLGEARKRGYRGSNFSVIPPMVDTAFYTPHKMAQKRREESFTIFTAARLEWVKGFEFALQAIALLIERGWSIKYLIAGNGELWDMLLYTIHDLGIQNNVELLGWQDSAQVRERMQSADIYLLTSVSEAFNNSVLQAQACNVPVVCSDEGGLPENIIDKMSGLLVKCRDAWDTADKIESLLRSVDKRQRLGNAGAQRIRTEFSLDKGTHKFKLLYEKIIKNEKTSPALQ